MMRTGISCKLLWLVSLATLFLTGCRSSAPPVQFYTLNPQGNAQATANTVAINQPISIGIGPVAIPEILDRPQIVTRTGPNKLHIDEFHRWAGRLDEDISRVLAENISLLLATEQVAVYPWDVSFKPRYQVMLDVRRFEGRWGQDVQLEVIWKVIESQNRTTLRVKKSVITEPLAAKDYDTLISTKSQAVAKLCVRIAHAIRYLNTQN